MSIPFDNAVLTLQTMFPEWEQETLTTLLISNNYHVERTIETILTMQGDMSISENKTTEPFESATTKNNVVDHNVNNRHENAYNNKHSQNSSSSRYRGLKCDLPDNFLRPPSWHQSKHIIADEELALMLQNELFQKEVREVLGDEFFENRQARSAGNNGGASRSRTTSGSGAVRRDSRGNAVADDAGADMGILKALSSMGSAAKKNLSQLAERFSQSGSGGATTANGVSGTSKEFRPLVDSGNSFEDEEDGDEVISFEMTNSKTARNQHILQEHLSQQQQSPSESGGGGDSENPLLQYNNYRNTSAVSTGAVGSGAKKDK